MSKKTVVVAMSGGVDSTVCAALMKEKGYNVIGVTLQLFDYSQSECNTNTKTCCASKDIFDAQEACKKLEIEHYVLNYEDIFQKEVMEEFANQYVAGYTPIPCIQCNNTVKFRDLLKISKKLGATKLVTGHYVQKKQGKHGSQMHMGMDVKKDQSYFLFQTTQAQLDFLEFPLGHLTKEETRALAQEYDLKIATKPDSQNICFVPDGNYAKVVEKLRPNAAKPGKIVHVKTGEVLAMHKGIINYTVGQRHGLGISAGVPLYVYKIEASTNKIIVGPYEELLKNTFYVKDLTFLLGTGEEMPENLSVRVRSSCQPVKCSVNGNKVVLEERISFIAPGQAAVFYNQSRVIGGGFIESVEV